MVSRQFSIVQKQVAVDIAYIQSSRVLSPSFTNFRMLFLFAYFVNGTQTLIGTHMKPGYQILEDMKRSRGKESISIKLSLSISIVMFDWCCFVFHF